MGREEARSDVFDHIEIEAGGTIRMEFVRCLAYNKKLFLRGFVAGGLGKLLLTQGEIKNT